MIMETTKKSSLKCEICGRAARRRACTQGKHGFVWIPAHRSCLARKHLRIVDWD